MLNMFNTSPEVAQSDIDTAVLPLGSTEPKGPHLPIGLDFMLAERFAYEFCRGKAVYLLPVWPYSMAVEARGFRGTVALSQQTMWDVLGDIADNLARHGFKRLVILDFSNFNWMIKQRVRELNLDTETIQAVWVNPRQFAVEAAGKDLLPDHGGGAVETSLAMHLFPQFVKSPLVDFATSVPREFVDYRGLKTITAQGHIGRPSKATPELGASFYSLMMDKTRDFVDYALRLFPSGRPVESSSLPDVWWPDGRTPGAGDGGVDWTTSVIDIAHSPTDAALLVTGSTEQHGPALPLATDHLQAVEVGRRAAAELKCYLLPQPPFMTSWGHIRFRGTVTLRSMTARRVLGDIAMSLHLAGFRKLAIANIHGGNWVVKSTLIEIARALPDLTVVSTGDILAYRGQAPSEELHADMSEASFIKAFYPAAFKADKVVDFTPNCTASAFDFVGIGGVCPDGVWGYPSRGAEDAGRQQLAERAANVAADLKKAFMEVQSRFPSRAR